MVYNKISSDLIFSLTGYSTRPLKIYVEDEFAKAVIKTHLRRMGLSAKAEVVRFGAIENSFTLAAGLILQDKDISNCLIVLDGDKYNSLEEKLAQIKKALSGTEADIEDKWNQATSMITQFQLPLNTAPERFFRDLLVENGNPENELVKTALELNAVGDSHEWVEAIRLKLDDSEESVVKDIVAEISSCDKWAEYIKSVAQWLEARTQV